MSQSKPPENTAPSIERSGSDESLQEEKLTTLRRHIQISEGLLDKEYQKLGILTYSLLRHKETVQSQDAAMIDAARQIDSQRRVVDDARMALNAQITLSYPVHAGSQCSSCGHILADSDVFCAQCGTQRL